MMVPVININSYTGVVARLTVNSRRSHRIEATSRVPEGALHKGTSKEG
jgi:hypothetical protein